MVKEYADEVTRRREEGKRLRFAQKQPVEEIMYDDEDRTSLYNEARLTKLERRIYV